MNDVAIARCFQGVIDGYPATIVSDSGTELNRSSPAGLVPGTRLWLTLHRTAQAAAE
jgi:hypothetical protein